MCRVLALLLLLGCRGDAEQCRRACRNFAHLVEGRAAEAEIAAAPSEKRDALRNTEKEALDHRVDVCVDECVRANDRDAIDCLIGAKTAAQAHACTK
jgi:hypothetical protein